LGQTLVHIRRLGITDWGRYAEPIGRINQAGFGVGLRDSPERLRPIVEQPRAACFVALLGGSVAGYCLGAPLELFAHLAGVREDPGFGDDVTLFCHSLAVCEAHHGQGVARRLKQSQIVAARALGYRCIAGRHRNVFADAMWHLDRTLGARSVRVVRDGDGDGREPGACIYYHIDLETAARPAVAPRAPRQATSRLAAAPLAIAAGSS
jgi:GNAT superfamily N-acetyltransferase